MSNKAKGTAKTEAIIGTAATKLAAAVKSITEAASTAVQLEGQLTDYNLKVSDLEGKIGSLETEYSQKKAEKEFQLGLDYKTDRQKFAEAFLKENNMVAIVVEEDTKLRTEFNALKSEFDQKVNAEIGKARGIMENQYKNQVALNEAEYKAKEAQNLATINQLKAQLEFSEKQAELWKTSLDEERKAGVERAKASAIGQLTVGQNGGR